MGGIKAGAKSTLTGRVTGHFVRLSAFRPVPWSPFFGPTGVSCFNLIVLLPQPGWTASPQKRLWVTNTSRPLQQSGRELRSLLDVHGAGCENSDWTGPRPPNHSPRFHPAAPGPTTPKKPASSPSGTASWRSKRQAVDDSDHKFENDQDPVRLTPRTTDDAVRRRWKLASNHFHHMSLCGIRSQRNWAK